MGPAKIIGVRNPAEHAYSFDHISRLGSGSVPDDSGAGIIGETQSSGEASRLLPQSITTTEEPANQASQQP